MTDRNNFRHSLRFRILQIVLLSVAFGVVAFLLAFWGGDYIIDNVWLREDRVEARQEALLDDFILYVNQNQVSSTDDDALQFWSDQNRYATLFIYSTSGRQLRSSTRDGTYTPASSILPEDGTSVYSAVSGNSHLVKFHDGVYRVQIEDGSESIAYMIEMVVGILAALFPALVITFLFSSRLSMRIRSLSLQAEELSSDLNAEISIPGHDELNSLAGSLNQMRGSIVQKMESEKEAWQMNSELVTAMSHDIRTPMTSLLGYLDLVTDPDSCTSEEKQQYLLSARNKAMELKDLTDKLFRYTIVFGQDESFLRPEQLDGALLFEQLLSELMFDLTESGFTVEMDSSTASGQVLVDAMQFQRVFENILSNARKYADPASPIRIALQDSASEVAVTVSNAVQQEKERRESNRIGLKASARLMEMMGGSFTVTETNETFSVRICLPKQAENN